MRPFSISYNRLIKNGYGMPFKMALIKIAPNTYASIFYDHFIRLILHLSKLIDYLSTLGGPI